MPDNDIVLLDRTTPAPQAFYPESKDLGSQVRRSLVGMSDGANVTLGSKSDSSATVTTGSTSVISLLKGLIDVLKSAIPAGTNLIGKFGIDQTTNGTTNRVNIGNDGIVSIAGSVTVTANTGVFFPATQPVSIAAPLTIGPSTNLIGKFGIDQTTPGTTNKVSIGTDGVVGVSGSVAVTGNFYPATQPVSIAQALTIGSGSNLIGKFGIDQTTNGTTNRVNIGTDGVVTLSSAVAISGPVAVTGNFFQATQPVSVAQTVSVTSKAVVKITGAITVTTGSAYSAGSQVGGLITFTNLFGTTGSGILQTANLRSKSIQTSNFKLYLFSSNPTSSTWTNGSTPNINTNDALFPFMVITFNTPDSGLGTHTLYMADCGKACYPATSTIYGVLLAIGTPTFTTTSDLTIDLFALPD